jgi:pyridinium-3,5-biscarboxylic acid mononucleotide synthase
MHEVKFDFDRPARIGLSEAILCEGKPLIQLEHILNLAQERGERLLLTRFGPAAFGELNQSLRDRVDYDPVSRTGIFGTYTRPTEAAAVAVVSAGSSDAPVVHEAVRTLAFHGRATRVIMDVGVAGLWRIMEQRELLNDFEVVIVVAGMDGALFSVVGGLVGGLVIAVPTATGYGVAEDGATALRTALASCAPGVVVVNVGNGYGAACAALRVLRSNEATITG